MNRGENFKQRGRPSWNKGLSFSEETKRKMSDSHVGNRHSEETKQKIGIAHSGIIFSDERRRKLSLAAKKNWKNHAYARKVMHRREQSYPEKVFSDLCKVMHLDYQFVGDGQLMIGGKNPDFVGINNDHRLIEIWGEFFHRGQNPQDRIDFFRDCGYTCLIIKASDLKGSPRHIIEVIRDWEQKDSEQIP